MNEPPSFAAGTAFCANCGTLLQGPYCHACGQPARGEPRSLGALFEDAWHVLTHLDARLWRTLGLLLLRPGELTRAFFGGRRARYLPPFRLYLVLSLLLFASSGLFDALSPARTTPRELNAAAMDDPTAAAALSALTARDGRRRAAVCTVETDLGERFDKLVHGICERVALDGGVALGRALKANIPRMMFVFLPLMALIMRLLYWRPRHYYVEHLVFFLHLHAAFFLAFTIKRLLQLPLDWLSPALSSAVGVAFALYAAWYVYRAMRRYYRESRLATRLKFVALLIAYAICLALTFAGTFVLSALEA